MFEETIYVLALISVVASPIIFVSVKRPLWMLGNFCILVLFFASWFIGISHKGIPNHPSDFFFTTMIYFSLSMVWLATYFFYKKLMPTHPITTYVIPAMIALVACIKAYAYLVLPLNTDNIFLVIVTFHVLFIYTIILISVLAGMYNLCKRVLSYIRE